MSAFAARQQLWGAAAAAAATAATRAETVAAEKATPKPAPENEATWSKRGTPPLARPVATRRSRRQTTEEPTPANVKQQPQSIGGEGRGGSGASGEDSTTSPHPEPGGMLIRQHSSFKPDKKSLQRKAGGRLVVSTPQGEVSMLHRYATPD